MIKQTIDIDDLGSSKTYLSALAKNRGIVALLGSAVSIWAPSNLPNGQKITKELATIMAPPGASPESDASKFINRSAFEHIMERYPRPEVLQGIIARAFYPTAPNPVHSAFAQLINEGIIEHIITTNYDEGLERACAEVCPPAKRPQVIVTESEANLALSSKPMIFKIHGCAKPGYEKTLVVTLKEEGEMPAWKRNLLGRLMNGKTLLVCGYSGLDFEVCPELIFLSPRSLTWNSLYDPSEKEALTPNARRVLTALKGTVLVGDMSKMLTQLGPNCQAIFSDVTPSFVQNLINELDSWEMDKWRVWVLNGVGCASEAITVASRMCANSAGSDDRRLDSLLALAEAQFHSGLYKQSGATYREAALLARQSLDWEKRLKAELGIVEADRVAGYFFRAVRTIMRLSRTLPQQTPPDLREKVKSALALKRALLRRYPFYLSKLLRIPWLTRNIQAKVTSELSIVANYSAKHGNWFDLQHCEMLAGKFQIPFSSIYAGTTLPPPSQDGYRHLGYFLAELMAYRNFIASGEKAASSLAPDPSKQGLEYLKDAQSLGINPEVWKLARAMKKRLGKQAISHEHEIEQFAETAWDICEYTLPMRWLQRIRGEEA